MNSRVELVAGPVDLRQVRRPARPAAGPLKLIYATSRLDDTVNRIFLPALRRLLQDVGPQVEAHFWGPRPPADLPAVRRHAVVHDYDRYLRRFSAAGFEIGLAPLADDIFHRSKANTKFREYGACGIAGVYSDVDVYSDCVRNGETGLLVANDADAWYQALRRLVDDAGLRNTIQRQARMEVERNFSQERFETVFLRQIERLAGSSQPRRTLAMHPSHGGRRRSRITALAGVVRQAIGHVRRNGWARGWNSLRWLGSSGWSMLRLKWRLRR